MPLTSFFNKLTPPADDRYATNVAAEIVYLLYRQAKPSIIGAFIVASCLFYVLYRSVPFDKLFGWYGLICVVTLIRYSLIEIYFKKRPLPDESEFWHKLFICSAAFSGVAWAFAGTTLISANDSHQTFVACSLAAITAGAIPYFAGSRIACAVFVIPILLSFAVFLLLQPDTQHKFLGMLTLVYLGLLLISSFRTSRSIYNAVKLKFENDDLVNNLSMAKQEVEAINQELKSEIVERKLTEKLLQNSEEQYRLVTDALPVLISYIDTDLFFRFNNKVHEEWFQKSVTSITGKHLKEVLDEKSFSIFLEYYQKVTAKSQITYESILQMQNGVERHVSVTLIPHVQDGHLKGVFSLTSDMTPRISYLSTHDALTDLPNRTLFNTRFADALKHAYRTRSKVALLLLDLDHFKTINDTQGHVRGDELLVKVSERIKKTLGPGDTLARLGGDEFTILLENVTTTQIEEVAKKICALFLTPFYLNARDVFITTSIGISVYPDDSNDMQILLKNADMATYRAKEQGRNTYEFYKDEMNEKLIRKHQIETYLRAAVDKQEFILYYQPIVNITTQKVQSLETLLRWKHSQLGFIPPVEFVPIAEETGLIAPIGEWVLRNACLQILAWQNSGVFSKNMRISVNLSARQFREQHLAEMITDILVDTGVSGECLTLELTESLIMRDVEHSSHVINYLKELGIAISIDDFGTGYSSLNYLRRFPIDIIKIDKSFITDIGADTDNGAIVTAIIAMAHSLKMKVIAEGVETIEQCLFLRERECDEIQGHLFAEALPANEIAAFLKQPMTAKFEVTGV